MRKKKSESKSFIKELIGLHKKLMSKFIKERIEFMEKLDETSSADYVIRLNTRTRKNGVFFFSNHL
jgi:hypothetical protein